MYIYVRTYVHLNNRKHFFNSDYAGKQVLPMWYSVNSTIPLLFFLIMIPHFSLWVNQCKYFTLICTLNFKYFSKSRYCQFKIQKCYFFINLKKLKIACSNSASFTFFYILMLTKFIIIE